MSYGIVPCIKHELAELLVVRCGEELDNFNVLILGDPLKKSRVEEPEADSESARAKRGVVEDGVRFRSCDCIVEDKETHQTLDKM